MHPAITNSDPSPGMMVRLFFPYAPIPLAARKGFSGIRELTKMRPLRGANPALVPTSFSSRRIMAAAAL